MFRADDSEARHERVDNFEGEVEVVIEYEVLEEFTALGPITASIALL